MQDFFAPTDSRPTDQDVGISVGSPSLVGMLVGNSSDAVINGRPMKKRLVLTGATDQFKMLRWCN